MSACYRGGRGQYGSVVVKYRVIGNFSNETDHDISLFLEITCEIVILSPGQDVELLAEDRAEYFPVDVLYHKDGLQIYPKSGSPIWKIRFKGIELSPGHPTRLSDYD